MQEEQKARQETTTEQARVFRAQLPMLLKRLSDITDPRNPNKIKHKHTLLMIYGILTFVFQMCCHFVTLIDITIGLLYHKSVLHWLNN